MEEKGIYVYGVLNVNPEERLNHLPGIDGINNIYFIERNGIYSIASPVSLDIYGEGKIDKHMEDMIWVEERARRHFEIQQELSQIGVVVPMKFCTIYSCMQSFEEFFDKYVSKVQEGFDYLKDKEEWVLKLYCDKRKFMELNMGEERIEIQQKAQKASKGASYFLLKKLENTLDEKARDKIAGIKDECWSQLKVMAEKAIVNKNLSKQVTELSEDMILNAVFLLQKDKIQPFTDEVLKQEERFKTYQMRVELTGPWPMYNFSNLVFFE